MEIINAVDIIKDAHKNKYAIPMININNLEQIKACFEAAQENRSPIILGTTKGAIDYFGGFNVPIVLVKSMISDLKISVPVVLHMDHGDYDSCLKAIMAGYTSIMFDGSNLSFEENYTKAKELRKLSKEKNISLEAEVGIIGGKEDNVDGGGGELADPKQCLKMQEIGVDFLAAGIGNIHGTYPPSWKGLNFDVLQEIRKATNFDLPLVLHGGTGIPIDQVKKSIKMGVCKVNVGTAMHLANAKALEEYINNDKHKTKKGLDIRKMNQSGLEAMKQVVIDKILLCDSKNRV